MELTRFDPQTAAEYYENAAKFILRSEYLSTSLDTFHVLTLLAWIERKHPKSNNSETYNQMATSMAMELGIQDSNAYRWNSDDWGQHKLRSTWTSLMPMPHTVSASR
jgi:hypothetical protein